MCGDYYSFESRFIRNLPIHTINPGNPAENAQHDRLVELVDRMLSLKHQVAAVRTSYEKTALQRQIEITDKQIDRLVYELSGLTDEEIQIVEAGTQGVRDKTPDEFISVA
ncbi:hypothetical protein [Nitrolancea hollandica]|uniref:Uncharacterized protein n=1 Tax=Nitrolancea hollandica Lb TaxID=1129897 RepID=I4EKU3_9BACT|nr:hypothetical protein [Nitrolancea hollandica]CCF85305.1 hypothetical protein NITHO_480003 [Nitrolancea hollandica Lb]